MIYISIIKNDDELFSETYQRCLEDTYILTGNETRIVVATVGHPETSKHVSFRY